MWCGLVCVYLVRVCAETVCCLSFVSRLYLAPLVRLIRLMIRFKVRDSVNARARTHTHMHTHTCTHTHTHPHTYFTVTPPFQAIGTTSRRAFRTASLCLSYFSQPSSQASGRPRLRDPSTRNSCQRKLLAAFSIASSLLLKGSLFVMFSSSLKAFLVVGLKAHSGVPLVQGAACRGFMRLFSCDFVVVCSLFYRCQVYNCVSWWRW